ncbi:Abhydrolase family protein [Caldanaerobius fijiensis DSM 17918]|uniref:Abhydrolase family protein n=1 Tax=Caldanaerobius fijiensis DSM 17918 TaxID=1121256 RepID=A0A1M4XYC0_9THEO|nr:alpha/beta hydrolase family protein [Caldanaerobius fijiensis]SHE98313.1 Abhydrolase family protein [Caldanaerobius fijiensis DSM 17918]
MRDEMRPLYAMEKAYDELKPLYEFNLNHPGEFEGWKSGFRTKLIELLGGFPEKVDLNPEVVEKVHFNGYTREKVLYHTAPYVMASAYVLIPDGIEDRVPAVLALCGHGYGNKDIVGINEDGTDRDMPRPLPAGYHKDFALELVRRGMVVIAPEPMGFGERREEEDIAKGPHATSCRKASFYAMMMGKTLIGMRVWDTIRALDYLQERPEVDPYRIGCMGISGGGMMALFTTAVEDRIKAVVVSGYLCTFKDSVMSIYHCEDNYIPGILKYGEMYDIACLVAPRPMLIESGTDDPIFPIKAVDYAYERVKKAYELLGVPQNLARDRFEGEHQISGRISYDWLFNELHQVTHEK